jgi:hypothetical protein
VTRLYWIKSLKEFGHRISDIGPNTSDCHREGKAERGVTTEMADKQISKTVSGTSSDVQGCFPLGQRGRCLACGCRRRSDAVHSQTVRSVTGDLPALQNDRNRPEDVLKVEADEEGVGGDHATDCLRYLIATKSREVRVKKLRGI